MANQITQEQLKNMSPEQVQELIRQQCVFCKIIAGEIPAKQVYEDDHVLAVLDINPANPGHILVLPKKHYQILSQMPDEESAYLLNIAKKLSAVIFEALGAQGTNILQRNGQAAGQEVPHVHVHVIPRFENDNVGLTWQPKKLSEEEFVQVQNKIKESAKNIAAKKEIIYDISGRPLKEVEEEKQDKDLNLPEVKPRLP
jgi:histidine triad (HIT) family protein